MTIVVQNQTFPHDSMKSSQTEESPDRAKSVLLVRKNGKNYVSIVEVSPGEEYYGVTTAFISKKGYSKGGERKLLWEGSTPTSASPEQLAPLTNVTPKDAQVEDAWRSGQSKHIIVENKGKVKPKCFPTVKKKKPRNAFEPEEE